jgi:hypothetical protein
MQSQLKLHGMCEIWHQNSSNIIKEKIKNIILKYHDSQIIHEWYVYILNTFSFFILKWCLSPKVAGCVKLVFEVVPIKFITTFPFDLQ